jgi:predicted acyltransferase
MFTFFFLLLSPWPRLAAACLLLAVVEVLRPLGLGDLMQRWYNSGLGGPWGTFSLSFFALCASALGEMIKDAPTRTRLVASASMAVLFAAAGIAASFFFPFSKHLLSLSYILFTCGVSAGILALLVLCREILQLPIPLVGSLGRNPLFIYMLHAVLGVAVLAVFTQKAAAVTAWGFSLGVLVVCLAVAILLDRRKIYIKL